MHITLTAQVGGLDANKVYGPLLVLLRKSLKLLEDDYSSGLEKFRLRIRISGEVETYKEKTGVHYIRLMKTRKYVTGEIVLGKEVWVNKTKDEVVWSLCHLTEKLFLNIIERLQKSKIELKAEELMNDVNEIVLKNFQEASKLV